MGDLNTLPTDDADLENLFTAQQYLDVDADDNVFVDQTATDEYAIFLFKDKNTNDTFTITPTWKGKSSIDCSQSPALLQIFNRTSGLWETIDTDNTTTAGTEFTLTASVITNLDDYYDETFWVACRVYQEAI